MKFVKLHGVTVEWLTNNAPKGTDYNLSPKNQIFGPPLGNGDLSSEDLDRAGYYGVYCEVTEERLYAYERQYELLKAQRDTTYERLQESRETNKEATKRHWNRVVELTQELDSTKQQLATERSIAEHQAEELIMLSEQYGKLKEELEDAHERRSKVEQELKETKKFLESEEELSLERLSDLSNVARKYWNIRSQAQNLTIETEALIQHAMAYLRCSQGKNFCETCRNNLKNGIDRAADEVRIISPEVRLD